jgi:hypothetical protein
VPLAWPACGAIEALGWWAVPVPVAMLTAPWTVAVIPKAAPLPAAWPAVGWTCGAGAFATPVPAAWPALTLVLGEIEMATTRAAPSSDA